MRAKHNLKVRQPLKKIMVVVDKSKRDVLEEMKQVILEEINVKELIALEDNSGIVNKSAKPNFKVIGPKYGKLVKPLTAAIKELDKNAINSLEKTGEYEIKIDSENVKIVRDDVEIVSHEIEGWLVETEEGVTVAIDIELTEELIAEGYAREFVNRVQNMRKDYGLDVVDRIILSANGDEKLIGYINKFSDYIANEVLAENIIHSEIDNGYKQDWKIGDYDCIITIVKANN
jgi:isoleucyl-tRNA synthetase